MARIAAAALLGVGPRSRLNVDDAQVSAFGRALLRARLSGDHAAAWSTQMDLVARALFRGIVRTFVGLVGLTAVSLASGGAAHACSCKAISPAEAFDRAQYVFTGKVVKAGAHTWVAKVDRVWKGRKTLTSMARLMDVYAGMDCEFYFKKGERYLFFAIVAKSPKDVFYHPQVCNLTSALHTKRVRTRDGESMWLEDAIVKQHGPGGPPTDMSGSGRLP